MKSDLEIIPPEHKADGHLVRTYRAGDEFWIGPVRIVIKAHKRISIQAPREMVIECVQPWKDQRVML